MLFLVCTFRMESVLSCSALQRGTSSTQHADLSTETCCPPSLTELQWMHRSRRGHFHPWNEESIELPHYRLHTTVLSFLPFATCLALFFNPLLPQSRWCELMGSNSPLLCRGGAKIWFKRRKGKSGRLFLTSREVGFLICEGGGKLCYAVIELTELLGKWTCYFLGENLAFWFVVMLLSSSLDENHVPTKLLWPENSKAMLTWGLHYLLFLWCWRTRML